MRQKTINKLMSSGIKANCLREMLNLKVKGRKVKKTLPLPSSETKNRFRRFLAMREYRRMEKPLISKLQLRIMREKINRKLGEREWKKLEKELEQEYGPKHVILPSEGGFSKPH
ncbi:hypothetical protein AVEN_196613-1 [Araneus ventricosus]|uniref:Uncharacterized protein n=1 Tax=Araneus ventricosus TaxID=182803 RepID=A0A4Y2GT95_ARAVE|nr:hypothetical protein AVEN_196613-1 [Araneus ventricosus]